MNLNEEKESGSFYFDKENQMCAGNIRLTEFVEKFTNPADSTSSESSIELTNRNEMVAYKTRLQTPLVIYSKKRLLYNITNYTKSFRAELTDKHGIDVNISYSLKANFNPSVLKLFLENGSWVSLVNKNELKLALKSGASGHNLIFNGNGKKLNEIDLAIRSSCFINIDSEFNLNDTLRVAKKLNEEQSSLLPAKLLLRVNVSPTAQVHSYLDTSGQSKFGIEANRLDAIIESIKSNANLVRLAGFHIHLGSTIKTLDVYKNSVANLVTLINNMIEKHDIDSSIELINFGGGLGIHYERFAYRTYDPTSCETQPTQSAKYPTPRDLAQLIGDNVIKINAKKFKVIVEPGRSLVGDSAILLTNLIGVKRHENKSFFVVDASMCECIRPCLYSAYHHIDFISQPQQTDEETTIDFSPYDVVGPVCESGDFLGKFRHFRAPDLKTPVYMAVMDVGAYCSSMANNYNLHQKPAEVFIDEYVDQDGSIKARYLLTRRPDSLDDILGPFIDY